jgi:hypothetical protein
MLFPLQYSVKAGIFNVQRDSYVRVTMATGSNISTR